MHDAFFTSTSAMVAALSVVSLFVGARVGIGEEKGGVRRRRSEPRIAMPRRAPKGAVVLFSGRVEEIADNWYERFTYSPGAWVVDAEGATPGSREDICSRREFGDCLLHVEFRPLKDEHGKTVGDGNSGVALQGRYEVQVLDCYYNCQVSPDLVQIFSPKVVQWFSAKLVQRRNASGRVGDSGPEAEPSDGGPCEPLGHEFSAFLLVAEGKKAPGWERPTRLCRTTPGSALGSLSSVALSSGQASYIIRIP